MPPVIHVDTDAPLYSDGGRLITDQLGASTTSPISTLVAWGGANPLYCRQARGRRGGGPYGPASPEFVVGAGRRCGYRRWRIAGPFRAAEVQEPSGGIGLTPDSFPVFDSMRENCFVIADSNHGYKMIGVGELVAQTICGDKPGLLDPFRFSRYAEGDLHPVSNSPFPWS